MSCGSSWVGTKAGGASSSTSSYATCSIQTSLKNTILVSVFEAGDSTTNLHTALDMYKEHATELQGMPLKYGLLSVFQKYPHYLMITQREEDQSLFWGL